jgi:PhzF family phenazine biosynthesis protein
MMQVLRYAAFSDDPAGGNPAGVVLEADLTDAARMQRVAAEIGDSETVFVRRNDSDSVNVRYFAPATEVPFCGHATIAAAVALAERDGPGEIRFETQAGVVPVVTRSVAGRLLATLVSVDPDVREVDESVQSAALAALGWHREDLNPLFPVRSAYAGAEHLILVARTRQRLAHLDYDVESLRTLMQAHNWTTVHLAWPQSADLHHVRDPFPVGGVYEDPATGAAAAAYGAYLRELGAVPEDGSITLLQGEDMGRPSRLEVQLVTGDPRVRVSGTAVAI